MMLLDRREFCLLAAATSLSLLSRGRSSRRAIVRIGVLVPATGEDRRVRGALDGITLGAEESARTAALFGADVEIMERYTFGADDPVADAALLLDDGADALLSAFGAEHVRAIDRLAAKRERLVVHLVAPPPDGRADEGSAPPRWGLHVAPAAGDRAESALTALHDVVIQREAPPVIELAGGDEGTAVARTIDARVAARLGRTPLLAGAIRPAAPAADAPGEIRVLASHDAGAVAELLPAVDSPVRVVDLFGVTEAFDPKRLPGGLVRADAWRPTLQRYGAAQLNDRFRARFGSRAAMHGPAWAGWFAMKSVVETALRGRGGAGALRQAMLTARFDGHKGAPLAFSRDGTLTQPLYVIATAI